MTSRRTICQEAHELLLARQESDGDLTNTWRRIAEEVSRRTGEHVSAETALWVLVQQALEHDRLQPRNAVHLREAVAYLGTLAQVRADEQDWSALTGRTHR